MPQLEITEFKRKNRGLTQSEEVIIFICLCSSKINYFWKVDDTFQKYFDQKETK